MLQGNIRCLSKVPLDDILPMELTKLHFSEIKESICAEYGVMSSEWDIALHCSNNQLIILDLLDSTAMLADLSYNISYAEIPQENGFRDLMETGLNTQCERSNLLELQRLALETSYGPNSSCELQRINVLQFKRAPMLSGLEKPIAVILTEGGLCKVLKKNSAPSRHWSEIFNVNEYLSNESKANNYTNFYQESCISAVAWHKSKSILFLSFDNGYIVGLTFYNAYTAALKDLFISKSNLEKVCEIVSFDDYLLVSCRNGILQVFALNNLETSSALLSPLNSLWDKKDNIPCSLIHIKNFSSDMYLIVANKGTHILVYMLSTAGNIISFNKLHIGGIKVTGVQLISASEFIVTTAMSYVRYFRVNVLPASGIKINEQLIKLDLDSPNLEIIGLVPSHNSNLLTLILHRSGEYSQRSNSMHDSIFVMISKLQNKGTSEEASATGFVAMSQSDTFFVASKLHTLNKYSFFSDVINTNPPSILDEGVLHQLQAKFALISNLLDSYRFKQNMEPTIATHKFLSTAIRITHTICRLKYLHSLESLTPFQEVAKNVYATKFNILIRKFKRSLPNKYIFERTKEMYLKFFMESCSGYVTQRETNWNESCLYCGLKTNESTLICENNHRVKRCYISNMQLPIITSHHCPRCQYYILEDDSLLQQLFATNEAIECILCRSLFARDCI